MTHDESKKKGPFNIFVEKWITVSRCVCFYCAPAQRPLELHSKGNTSPWKRKAQIITNTNNIQDLSSSKKTNGQICFRLEKHIKPVDSLLIYAPSWLGFLESWRCSDAKKQSVEVFSSGWLCWDWNLRSSTTKWPYLPFKKKNGSHPTFHDVFILILSTHIYHIYIYIFIYADGIF